MSADLALATDPAIVEAAADPGEFIIQACERAKTWLASALEHGDIDLIVECKSQAEAIRVYTMSKQLGEDARLSAEEIIRRAERGIGVAIRRGQADGTIRRQGQSRVTHQRGSNTLVASPTDFASHDELAGNGSGIYDLTDDVTDDEFEEAIADAKAEKNLTRANTVRKARVVHARSTDPAARLKRLASLANEGHTSRQIAAIIGVSAGYARELAREAGIEIPADQVVRKTLGLDSNRIVRETVHALEGAVMGIELVQLDDLDPAEIEDWTASLTHSIRALNRLIKSMKETVQ